MTDEEVDELLKAVDTSSGEINYTGLSALNSHDRFSTNHLRRPCSDDSGKLIIPPILAGAREFAHALGLEG